MDVILKTVETQFIKILSGTIEGRTCETSVVYIIAQFIGCTPKGIAIAYLNTEIKDQIMKWIKDQKPSLWSFYFYMNGNSFEFRLDIEENQDDDDNEYFISLDVSSDSSALQCQRWITVSEGYDIDVITKTTFDFCCDVMKCSVCPLYLAQSSAPFFGHCQNCMSVWNEVACSICKSHFGIMIDHVHVWH